MTCPNLLNAHKKQQGFKPNLAESTSVMMKSFWTFTTIAPVPWVIPTTFHLLIMWLAESNIRLWPVQEFSEVIPTLPELRMILFIQSKVLLPSLESLHIVDSC